MLHFNDMLQMSYFGREAAKRQERGGGGGGNTVPTSPFLLPLYSSATLKSRVVDMNAVSVKPELVMNGRTSSPPDESQ